MFDNVGKARKGDRKRQAGAFALSIVLIGSGGAFLAWLGRKAVEVAVEQELIPVELFEAAAPPPPPPPPPPAGSSKPKTTKTEEPKEPDPDIEPEPTELPEEIPEPQPEEASAEPAGEAGGVEGGVEGGQVGGVVGGDLNGVLGGELGGTGVTPVHHSQVKIKNMVEPVYPEAAKALGLSDEVCEVRFVIDEAGKPTEVGVGKCSKVFHDALRVAAMKWKFYPCKAGGRAYKCSFVQNIRFVLK